MKKKLSECKYEIIIITLFVIMSVTMCSHYTINFDEYFTMQWCRIPLKDFFYEVLHDTSPFLYYFMIRPFVILTNHNIFLARLFSLIALMIILLIGATFVKKNFGQKSMLFYLAIIYLNPFMLQKSTEIRMYCWATAFTLLSGVFCYKLLNESNRKNWIYFTFFSLLAAYTHYYAVLTMVFLYLGLLFYYLGTHSWKAVKNWIICSLVTIMAYLLFLIIAIAQIKESSGNWIDAPSSNLAPLKELFYSEIPGSEYFYLLILVGFSLSAFIAFLSRKTPDYYWALVCCSAIWGIMFIGIISAKLIKPIVLSRYLVMPVCLLFLGICPITKHINKYFLILLCIPFIIISSIRYTTTINSIHRDHTVDTIHFAEENISDEDTIILLSGDDYLYNCSHYYIPQANLYYAGSFSAELFQKENTNDVFWFFDNGNYMDQELLRDAGLIVENCGQFQFGYIHMTIYKVY